MGFAAGLVAGLVVFLFFFGGFDDVVGFGCGLEFWVFGFGFGLRSFVCLLLVSV